VEDITMILRPYQIEMAAAIRACWASGQHRVLGVLPTGAGKTEVAVSMIRDEATPCTRALVLVERKVLAHQWIARLRAHGCNHVGLLQGDNSIGLSAPIIVATAQSIRTRGIPEYVSLLVVDESHVWHATHDTVLEQTSDARVLGLTATPLREGMGLRFDAMVTGATIRSLIEQGHLVPPRYFAPAGETIERALEGVSIRAGDYAADQLALAMRAKAIVGDVVGGWQRRGEDRQTICFCVDKAHAADLAAEFVAAGVVAEVVVDDTPDDERARIFAAFDKREIRVLVSVGVLAVGFDSPVASCAILARPTLSTSLHIQQGGRVLRPYPGKADALIFDHAMNTMRHGKLEDFVPPERLSKIDKNTDKRSRRDPAEAWVCRACDAINSRLDDICTECGQPRRRTSELVVLDGELVPVEVIHGEVLPGPTLADVRGFYRMCMWYGRSKGFKKPEAWAYYATQRRFHVDKNHSKDLIEWDWRYDEPLVPDADAARWFRADFQRSLIVNRHRQQRGPVDA
jgi:superfamily II DNA or RNA helicase